MEKRFLAENTEEKIGVTAEEVTDIRLTQAGYYWDAGYNEFDFICKIEGVGIACYEDKIVQLALKKILEAIYEPRFLNCMYGFRPNRGCHNAIKELYKRLNNTKICYIVDADIKGFFDHMKHEWIIKFLKLYIKDPNIIGLVKKYLKVGVLDNGELMVNEEGSAQGNIISPILANIYMHNVLTLWYKFIITKECKGDNFLIV